MDAINTAAPCPSLIGSCLELVSPTRGRYLGSLYMQLVCRCACLFWLEQLVIFIRIIIMNIGSTLTGASTAGSQVAEAGKS